MPGDISPTSSASFVDADRDGIVDLWVGFWYKSYGASNLGVQARLFKGKGDGTFVDATKGSALETTSSGSDTGKNHRPAYGVTTCDLDDDGRPELLLSAYEGMTRQADSGSSRGKGRRKEAVERLVQLYEETGKTKEATEWKQKLAELELAESNTNPVAPRSEKAH